MKTIRGIVIQEHAHRETSKYLVVLAKGIGKIRLSAKGARRTKSPLLAGTQLFCYADFTVHEGRGFPSITQIEIIESFYGLRNDVEILSLAVYLIELVDKSCPDGLEQDTLLYFLLQTLQKLSKHVSDVELIGQIFELKYLQISGFLGELPQQQSELWFDTKTASFLHQNQKNKYCVCLQPAVIQAICYVLHHTGMAVFTFGLSKQAKEQLDMILQRYLQIHIGFVLPSRIFAKQLYT